MNKAKILIVDEEYEFASTLAERLELRGFPSDFATNAEEALSKTAMISPQIVILDIQAPGSGGVETMKRIKEQKPATEVILLTGHGAMHDGIDGVVLGAYDFLMKPVNMSLLLKKIKKAQHHINKKKFDLHALKQ